MNVNDVFEGMIVISLIAVLILFMAGVSKSQSSIEDSFSDYNIMRSMMYEIVSAQCLNDIVIARSELKKFIFDRSRLDKEQKNGPDISCLDLGKTKYRVYVKDLSGTGNVWIFSNYQPLVYERETYRTPDVEQLVQINDYTTPPISEDALIDFDKYKKGLVSASFIIGSSGKLQNEMFCEGNTTGRVFIIANNTFDYFGSIKSSYYYPANNCMSGNCIKGPGQAYATCQPKANTYDNVSGECTSDYECKSSKCIGGACADPSTSAPKKLIAGQPCMSNEHMTLQESCVTGVCKYGVICACRNNADCLSGAGTCIEEKGICI